jgi:ZIP family zinc transporter
MTLLPCLLASACCTLAGGFVALRCEHRHRALVAFSAGTLLGLVCFEVLPEIVAMSQRHEAEVLSLVAVTAGFAMMHALKRVVSVHANHAPASTAHGHPRMGAFSALALVGHSLIDGVGMGMAFQASPAFGVSVGLAIVAHDFCDGLATAGLMLLHGSTRPRALTMLLMGAFAPVVGAASTWLVQVPPRATTIVLGLFAGFLLHVGAWDLLPRAHSRTAGGPTTVPLLGLTAAGAGVMFMLSQWLA